MKIRGVHQVFLALVKAGLWERTIQLEPSGDIDFKKSIICLILNQ